jgi:hypothetical protein
MKRPPSSLLRPRQLEAIVAVAGVGSVRAASERALGIEPFRAAAMSAARKVRGSE